VRFSLAREAGFTEEEVQLIDGSWESSPFPPDWIAALKFTDHFILTPGPLPFELRNSLDRYFTKTQLSELAVGIGLFHGFSKMLIGLGREPEEMENLRIFSNTFHRLSNGGSCWKKAFGIWGSYRNGCWTTSKKD